MGGPLFVARGKLLSTATAALLLRRLSLSSPTQHGHLIHLHPSSSRSLVTLACLCLAASCSLLPPLMSLHPPAVARKTETGHVPTVAPTTL